MSHTGAIHLNQRGYQRAIRPANLLHASLCCLLIGRQVHDGIQVNVVCAPCWNIYVTSQAPAPWRGGRHLLPCSCLIAEVHELLWVCLLICRSLEKCRYYFSVLFSRPAHQHHHQLLFSSFSLEFHFLSFSPSLTLIFASFFNFYIFKKIYFRCA